MKIDRSRALGALPDGTGSAGRRPAKTCKDVGSVAHALEEPRTSRARPALEEAFTAAGAPDGVFTSLIVAAENVPDVSARLIADPRVAAVTLTGSERAGAFVAAEAGTALKKSVLELGGSDPFVVLADADLDTRRRSTPSRAA